MGSTTDLKHAGGMASRLPGGAARRGAPARSGSPAGAHRRSARRVRWQPVRRPAASPLAESRWRPLAFVACLAAITAVGLLYANRELAGDLFWVLAAGRPVDVHGVTATHPFLTIAHRGPWYNPHWVSGGVIFSVQ